MEHLQLIYEDVRTVLRSHGGLEWRNGPRRLFQYDDDDDDDDDDVNDDVTATARYTLCLKKLSPF